MITEEQFRDALHDRVGPALAQLQPAPDLLEELRTRQSRHNRVLIGGVSAAVLVIAVCTAGLGHLTFGRSTTTPVGEATPSAVPSPAATTGTVALVTSGECAGLSVIAAVQSPGQPVWRIAPGSVANAVTVPAGSLTYLQASGPCVTALTFQTSGALLQGPNPNAAFSTFNAQGVGVVVSHTPATRGTQQIRLLLGCGHTASSCTPAQLAVITVTVLPATAPVPVPPTATPNTAHEQTTRAAMQALLAQVPLPPGSQVAVTAPVPMLTAPPAVWASTNVVDVSGWWTTPGTLDDVLTYLKAHPPVGTTGVGTASGDQSGDGEMVSFDTPSTGDYADSRLLIVVSTDAGRVAIRADAQAIWRPTRTAGETLDAATLTAGSVKNTGFGGGGPSGSSLAFTTAQLRQVVTLLNQLDTAVPINHSCPEIKTTRTLTFDTTAGQVQFNPTNCITVTVDAAGAQQPALQDSPALENWLNALLGAAQSAPPGTNSTPPSAAGSLGPGAQNTSTP